MKKLLVTIVALALALTAFVVSASATSVEDLIGSADINDLVGSEDLNNIIGSATIEDVIAAAKKAVPDEYEYLYLTQLETVLKETKPTAEQCAMVIEKIEKHADVIIDKGPSLSEYTEEEVASIMADIDEVASEIGFEYEMVSAESDDPTDLKMVVYVESKPITEVDGDIIEQTGVVESASMVWPVALTGVVLLAAAAFVFGKKIFA